jgi:Second Messenger Oligonucleotide or Dinucleotide Synthetase domain
MRTLVRMATTVARGFSTFLTRLVPTDAQVSAASKHRQTVYDALNADPGLSRFPQTGSFSHGTGVRNYSDVDYMAVLKNVQPTSSDSALNKVRSVLQIRFPSTTVKVRRPAVVVEFASGAETYEIVPAYYKRGSGDERVYEIPGRASGWIESAPDTHVKYVTDANKSPSGGAKALARLLKAWKYYRSVPISSFYLEMRAAEHMDGESSFVASIDLRNVLSKLSGHGLAALNDPSGLTGRIHACGTQAQKDDALSKLGTALGRANNAREAEDAGSIRDAFYYWDQLFNGNFPAYG